MTESEHRSEIGSYRGVLFQHIPKTAGSALTDAFCFSFQHFVRDAHLPGSPWCDIVNGDEPFFVSGHFSFASIAEVIERPDIYCFTVLRDPLEQVVSHVRWVKAYGDPGRAEKLAEIDPSIAQMARKMWSVSLDDVETLGSIIAATDGRPFRNLQTLFLRHGRDPKSPGQVVAEALDSLSRFNLFFVLNDLGAALKVLEGELGPLEPVKHSNRAVLDERPNLDDKAVRDFYGQLVDQDLTLFEQARAASQAFLADLN